VADQGVRLLDKATTTTLANTDQIVAIKNAASTTDAQTALIAISDLIDNTYAGRKVIQKAGPPTSGDLTDLTFGVFKNTLTGDIVLAVNDGGSIKTATIS